MTLTLSIVALVVAVLALVGVVFLIWIHDTEDDCSCGNSIIRDLREMNLKIENEELKFRLKQMEESHRATLDRNAYLSKKAIRLSEEIKKLKKRQVEAAKYLEDGLVEVDLELYKKAYPEKFETQGTVYVNNSTGVDTVTTWASSATDDFFKTTVNKLQKSGVKPKKTKKEKKK